VSRTLLALLLVPALAVAAPVPKAVKRPPSLDGRWELVELVAGGRDVAGSNPWVWEVRGEQLTQYHRQPDGTLRPDESGVRRLVQPAGGGAEDLDYTTTDAAGEFVYHGLAAVDGDELVVCYPTVAAAPRPAERKAGLGVNYCRFRRVTDEKK
jgi:uncharacterized protein (TIGR03067 family)